MYYICGKEGFVEQWNTFCIDVRCAKVFKSFTEADSYARNMTEMRYWAIVQTF